MHVLNDAVIQALCWTLIHSLWQGLVAATIAGIMIMLTKKASSVARYNSLAAIFLLFMATSFFTFTKQLHIAAFQQPVKSYNPQHDLNAIIINVGPGAADTVGEAPLFTGWINYLNSHAAFVVTAWLIVLSIRLLKLMANVNYVRRVRHRGACPPSPYWHIRVRELATRLRVKRTVALLESAFIKVPMTAGVLKPVIFFPLAMISQIPPEQVEAVLLHELAHIKRRDYFVNVLQRFAEALFFFNPGVLWISSLIRDERENCCDDIAIGETKNKQQFIHALVSFQEYNLADQAAFGMAFPGRKNHLLERVNRIITNNNKTLNSMEKIFLAGCFAATAIAALAFSNTLKNDVAKQPVAAARYTKVTSEPIAVSPLMVTGNTDTLPVRTKKDREYISSNGDETTFYKEGYKIVFAHDKIVALYIRDKKIADDKIAEHLKEVEERVSQIKQDMHLQTDQLDQQQALLALKQANLAAPQMDQFALKQMERDAHTVTQQSENLNRQMEQLKLAEESVTPEQLKNMDKNEAERLTTIQNRLKLQNEQLQLLQQKIIAENKNMDLSDDQKTDLLKLKKEQLTILERQIQLQKLKLDMAQSDGEPAEPAIDLTAQPVNPVLPIAPVLAVQQDKSITAIINLLMDEKIISNRDNLTFTLNEELFEVNGVNQPEALHKKLAAKYIHGPKDHIVYSHHGGSTHTEISTNN